MVHGNVLALDIVMSVPSTVCMYAAYGVQAPNGF